MSDIIVAVFTVLLIIPAFILKTYIHYYKACYLMADRRYLSPSFRNMYKLKIIAKINVCSILFMSIVIYWCFSFAYVIYNI